MGEDAAKDAFYLILFTCLKQAPTSDKVVVLKDFNAELGNAWQEQGHVTRKFHLHRSAAEPSNNGAHLLDLAATFHLRTTNTFFNTAWAIWQHGSTPPPIAGTSKTTFWSQAVLYEE
jgi:hypothetical protein